MCTGRPMQMALSCSWEQAGCCADYELHEHGALLGHQARDLHAATLTQQARNGQRQSLTLSSISGSLQASGNGMARTATTCARQQSWCDAVVQ